MSSTRTPARIAAVHPIWAVEGSRITIEGSGFPLNGSTFPEVTIGAAAARVVYASSRALSVIVPAGLERGRTPIRIDGVQGETAFLEVGTALATGLHQVDSPVFDHEGNLYVTYSGTRDQQAPVSIFRVRRDEVREPFCSSIVNPTSMAVDAANQLYVSSRFEGAVYRVARDGSVETVATQLGVACGLAFDEEGRLYVGDRSGTIFRLRGDGRAEVFASLPPSVAAFHLAMGPDGWLYVTGPTLATADSVYRIDPTGSAEVVYSGFGRPQGLGFDHQGHLYIVEALAGSSGLYRLHEDGRSTCVLGAPTLVGVAFDPWGGLIVASPDTVYRFDVEVRGPGPRSGPVSQ